MGEKVIRQQPVTFEHVRHIAWLISPQAIDADTSYQPVDETGAVIGEPRVYREHFYGPDRARLIDFLTTELLPDINEAEGTADDPAAPP